MVVLRYKGTHQPQNMLVEIEEKEVKRLIDSGLYESVTITPTNKPTFRWTENEILNWIIDNNIPINYSPQKHTKKYVFKLLTEGGYL